MARNDFTNDGVSDLLFYNRNTDSLGIWDMAAGGVSSYVIIGQLPTGWSVSGSGDYNGNGTDDILFRQSGTGTVGYWNMVDGVNTGFVPLIWETSSPWSIVKTQGADFNGDGRDDILWRNENGDLGIYRMTGGGAYDFAWDVLGNVPTDWQVLGADDFNGDARADILWRNSGSGQVGYYAMDGGVQGWVGLGTATSEWRFEGMADFDGDHFADILWSRAAGFDNVTGAALTYSGYWDINDGALGGFTGGRIFASSNWPSLFSKYAQGSTTLGDYTGDGSEDIAQVQVNAEFNRFGIPAKYSLDIVDYDNGVSTVTQVGTQYSQEWNLLL